MRFLTRRRPGRALPNGVNDVPRRATGAAAAGSTPRDPRGQPISLDDTLKTSVGDFQPEITKPAGRRITTASLRRTDRYNTQPQLLLGRTAHDTTQAVDSFFSRR